MSDVPAARAAGAAGAGQDPLLEVTDLVVEYPSRGSVLTAVDHVSLSVPPGRTLGLVGESGSGKSSVARSVLGLTSWSGEIRFEGRRLDQLSPRELRRTRARLQMIFQDPYGTLDPRMKIGRQIAEPLLVHGIDDRDTVGEHVAGLLERVGLHRDMAGRYPHEFSGGQRQRVAIARAIGLSPSLIVCDEPTSALDVSVQAQVLELLEELQREHGMAYLFITHNLGVVRRMSHDVAVMYRGQVVESGPVDEVFENPQHAYTRALLDAVLEPDPGSRHVRPSIARDLTSPADILGGSG